MGIAECLDMNTTELSNSEVPMENIGKHLCLLHCVSVSLSAIVSATYQDLQDFAASLSLAFWIRVLYK